MAIWQPYYREEKDVQDYVFFKITNRSRRYESTYSNLTFPPIEILVCGCMHQYFGSHYLVTKFCTYLKADTFIGGEKSRTRNNKKTTSN